MIANSGLVLLLSCFLALSAFADSVMIGGSCNDTKNALPGHPVFAYCKASAECHVIEHGNTDTMHILHANPFTIPFACSVGGTEHQVKASALVGGPGMSATSEIYSYVGHRDVYFETWY